MKCHVILKHPIYEHSHRPVCQYTALCVIIGLNVIAIDKYNYMLFGSFHVKSTDGFHGPPPILLKFGTLVGIV